MNTADFCKLINNINISKICFAANMLCINLGAERRYISYKGLEEKTYEFSINIQSPWRIVKNLEIIKASSDCDVNDILYEAEQQHHCIASDFHKIIGLKISSLRDLKLIMDNGYILEVFADSSQEECWRIISHDYNIHIICQGNSISIIKT